MDLGMMTGKGALRLAKQESGLTQSEIADRLGVSHAVTKRYFNVNDKYMPSLKMIPRLCSVLGNDILMRWMEARLRRGESVCREEIAEALSRTGDALEGLRALVEEDGSSPVRDVQHAVEQLIVELGCIQSLLAERTFCDGSRERAFSVVEVPEEMNARAFLLLRFRGTVARMIPLPVFLCLAAGSGEAFRWPVRRTERVSCARWRARSLEVSEAGQNRAR